MFDINPANRKKTDLNGFLKRDALFHLQNLVIKYLDSNI